MGEFRLLYLLCMLRCQYRYIFYKQHLGAVATSVASVAS
jgi:hypothetical protein